VGLRRTMSTSNSTISLQSSSMPGNQVNHIFILLTSYTIDISILLKAFSTKLIPHPM
jgi:hypothetical protein